MASEDHKILMCLLESHAHLMVAVNALIADQNGENKPDAIEALKHSTGKMVELLNLIKGKNEEP